MRMPPPVPENQNSSLLSTDENLQVFKLLGNKCQTLATTVVQIFITSPPHHMQWTKKDTGVLCFVRDNSKKNFFFRLFCLQRDQMVWEHEMYNNMEYTDAKPFFHVFEGEDYMVGFNFANESEAYQFKRKVDDKIEAKRRKEERRARQLAQSQTLRLPSKNLDLASKQEFKREKRKRNITKADISTPMDFIHISHVGWNPNTGFDVLSEDEQLKALFHKAGVSKKQLEDQETREFIYDFINKHRNDALVSDLNPPVVPPRGPSRPPSSNPRPAPPPPPVHRTTSTENHVKKPRPPSPPKQATGPAPPPPPPLPSMNENIPPPPPPMNGVLSPPSMDGSSALMQSIRDGTTLKPVEKPAVVDGARDDLLSEIRKGIQLKPVDEREIKPSQNPSPPGTGGNDLANALKQALLERSKYLHSEDDDDDTSSTSNDDEWDD